MRRSSVAAITRIGWRNIGRSRGRSALIVLLVLLPVAAMAAAITLISTVSPTAEETAAHRMGLADYEIQAGSTTTASLEAALPDGAVVVPWSYDLVHLVVPGRTVELQARSMDLDGLAAGMLVVTEGRQPSNEHEVAISAGLALFTGTAVGGQVQISETGPVTVVGLVEDTFDIKGRHVLLDESFARRQGDGEDIGASAQWLVALPDASALPETVCADGAEGPGEQGCDLYGYSRDWASQPSADASVGVLVLGGLALVEAILVAAAAFAVSVRRRQRELGLLAAAGAERRHLAGTVLGEGILLGGLAAVSGNVIGIGMIVVASPWLDDLTGRRVGPIEINGVYLFLAGAVGLLACLLAAALPARAAARLPVLLALSGRRPPQGSARRLLVVGAALITLGTVLTSAGAAMRLADAGGSLSVIALLGGAILGVLGFGMCSPWLIERLEQLGVSLPPSTRIALRDSARARSRNAPIVLAILSAFAATVAISSTFASNDAESASRWQPWLRADQLIVGGEGAERAGAQVATKLGALAVAPIPELVAATSGPDLYDNVGIVGRAAIVIEDRRRPAEEREIEYQITIADAEFMSAFGAESAVSALDAGGLVMFRFGPDDLDLTEATVVVRNGRTGDEVTSKTVPVTVVITGLSFGQPVTAVLSRATAAKLGLAAGPVRQYVIRLNRPVTEADVAQAAAIAATEPNTYADASLGPPQPAQVFRFVLISLSLLFALSVTGIAVALGEAESRPDQRTLLAIGADPGIRRRIAAARAGILALMAGVLAVPAGLLPAWGLLGSRGAPLVVPVPEIIAAAAILPLAGIVGALFLTRRIPAWSALRQAGS
ncbi:MAG: FtsX-like permease family protein [Chloroflexota bacterium]